MLLLPRCNDVLLLQLLQSKRSLRVISDMNLSHKRHSQTKICLDYCNCQLIRELGMSQEIWRWWSLTWNLDSIYSICYHRLRSSYSSVDREPWHVHTTDGLFCGVLSTRYSVLAFVWAIFFDHYFQWQDTNLSLLRLIDVDFIYDAVSVEFTSILGLVVLFLCEICG